MNHVVKQLSGWTLALLLMAPPVTASERQSLQAVHGAVTEFVEAQHGTGAELEVIPDALDPRLRLAPCPRTLEAFWAPGSAELGQTTVGVRCEGPRPWKLYLPTRVRLHQAVAVARRPLARGQRLEPDDMALEKRDVGSLRAAPILDPKRVMGYVLTRGVPAGRVLDTTLLEAPRLVHRGRKVRLAVQTQGIHITMTGTALEDGALGETVRVRNPNSRRTVEGIVDGPGQVRLQVAPAFQKTAVRQ